jgi:WD40 repeat protein
MLRISTAAIAAGAMLASLGAFSVCSADENHVHATSTTLAVLDPIAAPAMAALLPPGFTTVPAELLGTLNAHSAAVQTLALAADGTALFSGGNDGHIRIWDTATLELILDVPACQVAINDIELDPMGTFAVTASEDGYVKVWDALTGELLVALPAHLGDAESSGAVGRFNETIRSAHGTLPRFAAERVPSVISAQAVAVSPDGLFIYTAGDDGYVRKYSVEENYSLMWEVLSNYNGTNDLEINQSGTFLFAGGMDGYVSIFNAELGTMESQVLAYEHGAINTVTLTSDENCLLTGSTGGEIRVWDAHTGSLVKIIRAHAGDVNWIETTADDALMISGGADGMIKVWNRDAELAGEMQAHVLAVADGAIGECVMFTGGHDFKVREWDPNFLPGCFVAGETVYEEPDYIEPPMEPEPPVTQVPGRG